MHKELNYRIDNQVLCIFIAMDEKKKDLIKVGIKSYVVGASMTVPGVSGGSMAMVLGIYDRIISSVPLLLTKDFKKGFLFLLLAGLCGLGGAFSASPVLSFLLKNYYIIVMFFFLGAIVGSIPMIIKKSQLNKSNWYDAFFIILGIAIVTLISFIPEDIVSLGESSFLSQFICGVLVSIGFVLPGISFTYLLVVLGLYESLIGHLSNLEILPLIPLSVGIVVGVFLLSGLLKKSMESFPQITFPIILGFLIGSLPQVFPSLPAGIEILFSLLSFVAGLLIIYFVSKE